MRDCRYWKTTSGRRDETGMGWHLGVMQMVTKEALIRWVHTVGTAEIVSLSSKDGTCPTYSVTVVKRTGVWRKQYAATL